jgi:hypothetical protein
MAELWRPLRFVVLHHTGNPGKSDHFDLLFESRFDEDEDARTLVAFATIRNVFPTGGGAGDEVVALEAHRRRYLTYEGPVSDGRGCVSRADFGDLIGDVTSTGAFKFHLVGQRLKGLFSIKPVDQLSFRFACDTF